MTSRKEEEDQKSPKISPEEDTVVSTSTIYEHIQYLFDSLTTTEPTELETLLASIIELFSLPATSPYRKEITRLATSFANSLMKVKTDRPFLLFVQMLQKAETLINRPVVAYQLVRFTANVGNSIRLLQKVKDENAKEEPKPSKEAAIEARKLRKKLKQEEANIFFVLIESLMLKITRLDERTLEKIRTGISTIGKKVELKANPKELQGNTKESLIKIFLCGLACKSDPALHLEIIQGFSALLGSEDGFERMDDVINFYRPTLSNCTDSEIEGTLAPQMVLLIKRSMNSFIRLAPIMKAFGKLTTHSLLVLVQTTLEDLISQEGSSSEHQNLLVETLKTMLGNIVSTNDKDIAEIIENLSFPWKQQLNTSELESKKQLNLIKILNCFFSSNKVSENHKKTLLSMIIELYSAIKQEEVSSETALFLSKIFKDTPETLYSTLYESFSTHIFGKSLKSAKNKNLSCSLLYPIVAQGVNLIIQQSPLIVNYLPSLTRTAWNPTIAQLNFNAITQFSYNNAVVALGFILDARDNFGKGESKADPNLKFVFSSSNVNRQEFIVQKSLSNFEASLHIYSVVLSALVYPSFVEAQSQVVLPVIANLLTQYAFAPKSAIRDQATKMTQIIYKRLSGGELGWLFAKDYQMAMYAFIKHANGDSKGYAPHAKTVLILMIEMLKETKEDTKIRQYFIKFFILIHSAKAAGTGKKKRNLADQMWYLMIKHIKNAKDLLKKTANSILMYLVSGKSLMSASESALVSDDQIQTIFNVVGTMAREGMGKQVLSVLKEIMRKDKLEETERLYSEIIEDGIESVSRFDLEFIAEEINDLKLLTEGKVGELKEEKKTVRTGKKPGKKEKKPVKEEGTSKEERVKEDTQLLTTYMNEIVDRVRTETKNVLLILRVLCKEWHTVELVQEVIDLGLLNELKGITQQQSIRFEGYLTIKDLFACLIANSDELSEAYFASINNLTSHKYVKICTAMFNSLSNMKIEQFSISFIDIILDISEFLIESIALTSSVKSKAVEVINRILLEATYDVSIIHRIAPIIVKLLRSSYQAENLPRFLQVFWTRALYNDMHDVVINMWNYDFPQQLHLFHSIYSVKRPLPNASWLSNILLQGLFSDNKEMHVLSKNIMNERTICLHDVLLEQGKPSGLIKMLNYKSKDLRDSAVRAISGYLEIKQSEMSTAIRLFIEEYENLLPACRRTIAELLGNTAHIVPESELKAIFEFLLIKGVAEENDVSKEFMESGIQIIQAQGKEHAGIIITAIEGLLNQGKKVLTDNASTIAVIFIGNVARYLAKDDPKLPKLHKTLQNMLSNRSGGVIIAVAKCLGYFASVFKEDSKAKITSILKDCREIEAKKIPNEIEMMSKAFALAGCVKGLGVKSIDEFEVMKILEEPFKEKCQDVALSTARKQNSLYAYAALSHTLGKTFEYYAVSCMSYILQCFAVGKENVRQTAQEASKAIISKLSGQGVKSILPSLLKELDTTNWRSKLAAVECLGSMAFMAPKQLSNYLPQIVTNIKVVLNDTQPKVHEAGINALTAIGSVIKNPEIADISGKIIQTLNNPTKELIYALDLLLQQSFAHAIDAPSLSLIIPILDYGLRAQNNEVKLKATQLVRSICKVISDPNDMIPYLTVIMPALKTALFDPIPEVRSASAKALGALCKGLGLENMQDIIVWVKSILQKPGPPVERSGAANGYAEIIAEQGTEYLEGMLEQLIERLRDKSSTIREGYFGLFLFLPLSFGESFEKYFTLILPPVLEALADPEEPVRNTANRVVQICIWQYGQKRTDVLLEPLFQRMLDSNWKIRESALGLMANLLSVLEKDIVKDEPVHISLDDKNRALAILYILRYDNIDAIRIAAAQVWKGVVDNQPKTIKIIMPVLIGEILELISKRGAELKEVGIYTLHDVAERFSERLLFDILKIYKERIDLELEDLSNVMTSQYVQGIATSLYEILGVIDYRLATENKWNIYLIIEPFVTTDDDELRSTIANTIVSIIHKDLDNDFLKKLSKKFTSQLLEYEKKEDTERYPFLQDLIQLVTKQKPKFGDDVVLTFSEEPLTPIKVTTFTAMAQHLSAVMFTQHRAKKLLDQLFRTVSVEGKVQESIIGFFQRCTELLATEEEREKWIELWKAFIEEKEKKPQRVKVYLEVYIHMFRELKEPVYLQYNKDMFERIVAFIDMDVGDIPVLMSQAIDVAVKAEGKDSTHSFISRIKQAVDEKVKNRRDYLLPIFNKAKTLETLLPIFQNTLMHASVELRIDAAAMYCYVIQLTDQNILKNQAAKIAGSLIRVVNDKFTFALKNKLLESTYFLMAKSGAAIKAFVSPLQTTLIKVINDPELSSALKSIIFRNVAELLKLMPKTDSLRAELLTTLKSPNNSTHPTALGALALIGKLHGATMKPEVISDLFSQVAAYLAKLPSPVDETSVAAAAFAMMSLCQTTQEIYSLLDLTTSKYQSKPEISNYLYFAMLFSPVGVNEPGDKFINNILGKAKFTDNLAVGRAMHYVQLFIGGTSGVALEEVLKIIEGWIPGLESLEWEKAAALLELIPFAECETMKIESDTLQQIKSKVIRYIARESEQFIKDGAKDLLMLVIGYNQNYKEQIKKWEEGKLIDHAGAVILLSLIK